MKICGASILCVKRERERKKERKKDRKKKEEEEINEIRMTLVGKFHLLSL